MECHRIEWVTASSSSLLAMQEETAMQTEVGSREECSYECKDILSHAVYVVNTLSYLTELSITASTRGTAREDVTRSLTVGPGCGMMVATVDLDLSHYR